MNANGYCGNLLWQRGLTLGPCAIVKNQKYVYFKKIVRGFWLKREILKENW